MDINSFPHLLFFESSLLLSSGFFGNSLFLLDLVSLICQLMHSNLIEILFIGLSAWVTSTSKSSIYTGCSAISGIVSMSNSRDGSNSNVFVNKVLSCKIIECLSKIWLFTNTLGSLALFQGTQFLFY